MKDAYSYLKDPRALAEIRKHKWIESQKQGREIGFATAAVDWVKKYGRDWKKSHFKHDKAESFIERRRYRRKKLNCGICLTGDNSRILGEALNLSYEGLLLRAADYLAPGSEAAINLSCRKESGEVFNGRGVVERAVPLLAQGYELFLRFDEPTQENITVWRYITENIG